MIEFNIWFIVIILSPNAGKRHTNSFTLTGNSAKGAGKNPLKKRLQCDSDVLKFDCS